MNKSWVVLYAGLIVSVILLRSTFLQNEKNIGLASQNISETYSAKSQNKTRILAQDPIVVKVCSDAESDGSVSQDQKDRAEKAYDEYRGAFGPEIGTDLMNSNVPESSKLVQKGIILVIIALFLIFTPILTLCYCCYCCCDNKCPCCCKRDAVKAPFTKREMVCAVISVCIYSALTFSACIAGYVYSNEINAGYKSTKCTVLTVIDDLNTEQKYTDPSKGTTHKFLGLDGIRSSLDEIINKFEDFKSQVSAFSSKDDDQKVSKRNERIKSELNALSISPITQDTKYSKPVSKSFFDLMGANSQGSPQSSLFYSQEYSKLLDQFQSQMDSASQAAVSAIQTAKSEASSFDGQNSLKTDLNNGLSSITDAKLQLSDIISDFDDTTQIADTIFSLITYILMAFYGVFIFIAVAGSILSVIGFLRNIYKIRYCLNVFWSVLGLLTFIGFIACLVLTIITILLFESCDRSTAILSSKEELDKITQFSGDIKDYLVLCKSSYGGNGDIMEKFNIQDQINTIKDTQQKILDVKNLNYDSEFETFKNFLLYFQKQHETMEGKGMFFLRTDTTFANPLDLDPSYNFQLDYFDAAYFKSFASALDNTSTNNNFKLSCINANDYDQVVFYTKQCQNNLNQVAAATFQTPLSNKNCISLEILSFTSDITDANISLRYAACTPGEITSIKDFYAALKQYVSDPTESVPKIFTKPETYQIKRIFGDNTVGDEPVSTTKRSEFISGTIVFDAGEFKKDIDSFKTSAVTLVTDSQAIVDMVIGDNGIINGINCLFFGAEIDKLQGQTCYNFAVSIYNTTKILLVVCFSNFTLLILLYKMAMRFLGEHKKFLASGQNFQPGIQEMEVQKMNQ